MKATKQTINDIMSFRDKVIEQPFSAKMTKFYNNSIEFAKSSNIKREYDAVTNTISEYKPTSDLTDLSLTQELVNIIGKLFMQNNTKFSVCTIPAVLKFYLSDDIILSDEVAISDSDFEFGGYEHAESVFNYMFLNKDIMLYSLLAFNLEADRKKIHIRYSVLNRQYLDISNINTLDIEMVDDLFGVDKTSYGSKVPQFGDYSINKMKDVVQRAGFNEIIYNQNKYKEINDNE